MKWDHMNQPIQFMRRTSDGFIHAYKQTGGGKGTRKMMQAGRAHNKEVSRRDLYMQYVS